MPAVAGAFLSRFVVAADLLNGGVRPEGKKVLLGSISYQEDLLLQVAAVVESY